MTVETVKAPEQIYKLLLRFDSVLPHLREKVTDYRAFSEKLAKYANVLCAVEGEKACGFAVFYANDESTKMSFLTLLACAREEQGKGLGKYLMEHAFETATKAGMTGMRLEVDLDNPGAIAFYKKLGFREVGEKLSGSMYMERKLSE